MIPATPEGDPASVGGRPPRVTVLYVIAYGRSGSTILGNILGELEDVVHVGELRSLWGLGLLGRRVCGCGVPLASCEFWRSVVKAGPAAPDAGDFDPREARRLQIEAVRLRTTRSVLRLGGRLEDAPPELRAYAPLADRLYRGISEVTGARVVVDTSKHVPDAALLTVLPNVDPYFVHLVRDPRAVAYSWRRVMRSPGEGRREEMPRHGAFTSGRSWLVSNLGAAAVRRAAGPGRSLMIRYEDFVVRPREFSERIIDLIGGTSGTLPFVDDHTVRLGGNHTAGGNPARLVDGATRIRLDDEWRSEQRAGSRFVATAFGLPLLHRYGYPLVAGRRR
ncbi:MAG: sulfotransferase [Actinomycetota bacterium]